MKVYEVYLSETWYNEGIEDYWHFVGLFIDEKLAKKLVDHLKTLCGEHDQNDGTRWFEPVIREIETSEYHEYDRIEAYL